MKVRELDPGWQEGKLQATAGLPDLDLAWKSVNTLKSLPGAGLGSHRQEMSELCWTPMMFWLVSRLLSWAFVSLIQVF